MVRFLNDDGIHGVLIWVSVVAHVHGQGFVCITGVLTRCHLGHRRGVAGHWVVSLSKRYVRHLFPSVFVAELLFDVGATAAHLVWNFGNVCFVYVLAFRALLCLHLLWLLLGPWTRVKCFILGYVDVVWTPCRACRFITVDFLGDLAAVIVWVFAMILRLQLRLDQSTLFGIFVVILIVQFRQNSRQTRILAVYGR